MDSELGPYKDTLCRWMSRQHAWSNTFPPGTTLLLFTTPVTGAVGAVRLARRNKRKEMGVFTCSRYRER